MARFDSDRNMWKDNSGMYHHSREDAIKANSSGGENFGTAAGGGGVVILIVVAIVGIIIFLFIIGIKYILTIVGIWVLYRIAKLILRKREATKKAFRWAKIAAIAAVMLVLLWAWKARQDAKPENKFYPTIATVATISDKVENDSGTAYTVKDRALVANEKVKLLGASGDGRYKIETSDGVVGFVSGRCIAEEGLRLVPPKSAMWRAMNWKFSDDQSRPKLLNQGTYYAGKDGNICIEIAWSKFNNDALTKGSGHVNYHNYKTGEELNASLVISKNEPPVEINGVPYNYSMKIENARKYQKKAGQNHGEYIELENYKGFTGDFVVTGNGSFVSEDGKTWTIQGYY